MLTLAEYEADENDISLIVQTSDDEDDEIIMVSDDEDDEIIIVSDDDGEDGGENAAVGGDGIGEIGL